MGTASTGSGTGPSAPAAGTSNATVSRLAPPMESSQRAESSLCSRNTTGPSASMAARMSPAASAGTDGTTTVRPGIPASMPQSACSCWPPSPYPPPHVARTTSGTDQRPPEKLSTLDISFRTALMATAMKSTSMISTTGRSPAMAAPTAAPRNADSLMGAPMTRSPPNRANRALRSSGTSSPNTRTRSSRPMASATASSMAAPNSRVLTAPPALRPGPPPSRPAPRRPPCPRPPPPLRPPCAWPPPGPRPRPASGPGPSACAR